MSDFHSALFSSRSVQCADPGENFRTYCVTCHGAEGTGDVEDIKAIVHDGAAKHGGSSLMAPWPTIKPDQLPSRHRVCSGVPEDAAAAVAIDSRRLITRCPLCASRPERRDQVSVYCSWDV